MMLKHRCAALLIFTMLKHHCSMRFISSHSQNTPVHHLLIIFFPKQPRLALVSTFSLLLLQHHSQQPFIFSPSIINETIPSSNCFALLHNAETSLIQHSSFLPIPKTFQSAIFHHSHSRNNSVQHLFRFSPSIAETPLAATFPVAETPATFHFLPVVETPIASNPSSLFQC